MTLFDILVGKKDKLERINLTSKDKTPTLIILEAYQPKLSRAVFVYMKPLSSYSFHGYVLENSVEKRVKEEIISVANPQRAGYKNVEAYYWKECQDFLEEVPIFRPSEEEIYSKLSELIKNL